LVFVLDVLLICFSNEASSCPNEECNVRIHEYCLRKRFSQRKVAA
jgi:hypothetical protein